MAGEILSVGGSDKSVDALVLAVPTRIRERGVDGERLSENSDCFLRCLPAEALCEGDGFFRGLAIFRDSEIPPLCAEPACIRIIGDVVFDAIRSVEPHRQLLARRSLYEETVAVRPFGGHQPTVF